MTQAQNFPSQNTGRGFFGTIASHVDPDEAWPVAMAAIGTATGCPAEAVRNFLDSNHGRHFAEEAANGLLAKRPLQPAIDDAVDVWMAQPVGRLAHRLYGIPSELPCLTGYVNNCKAEVVY